MITVKHVSQTDESSRTHRTEFHEMHRSVIQIGKRHQVESAFRHIEQTDAIDQKIDGHAFVRFVHNDVVQILAFIAVRSQERSENHIFFCVGDERLNPFHPRVSVIINFWVRNGVFVSQSLPVSARRKRKDRNTEVQASFL